MEKIEKAYQQIEGEWQGFEIRRIREEDEERCLEHFCQNFLRDEPTSKLLGWSEEYANDMKQFLKPILRENLSFYMEDKKTGDIAALRIIMNRSKDDKIPQMNSRKGTLLVKMINDVEELGDFPDRYKVHQWVELFAADTGKNYRNMRIATEFYSRSLKFLEALGHKYATVITTSPYTRKATTKKGFKDLSRLNYENLLDYEGKKVFLDDELTCEHFAIYKVKEL